MKTKMKGMVAVIFISALITSCSKAPNSTGDLYVPTSADATATATLADLQQGRTLYINNCDRCHGLYSPDNYTSTQWKNSIMPSMGSKTSMMSSEKTLVTKYVTRGK
jgi:cytochrome c5